MHIILEGYQEYEVDGIFYKLEQGDFLIICPNVPHTVVRSASQTEKFSITFNKHPDESHGCLFGTASPRMESDLEFLAKEASLKKEISGMLIENIITECLVLSLRVCGIKENETHTGWDQNATITLAKQYIDDNIETNLTVTDVSAYCYLSTKQLTRLFQKFEGVSPGSYIIKKRIKRIEALLADPGLSLKQIGSLMHFENEYYFNAFFKKFAFKFF